MYLLRSPETTAGPDTTHHTSLTNMLFTCGFCFQSHCEQERLKAQAGLSVSHWITSRLAEWTLGSQLLSSFLFPLGKTKIPASSSGNYATNEIRQSKAPCSALGHRMPSVNTCSCLFILQRLRQNLPAGSVSDPQELKNTVTWCRPFKIRLPGFERFLPKSIFPIIFSSVNGKKCTLKISLVSQELNLVLRGLPLSRLKHLQKV